MAGARSSALRAGVLLGALGVTMGCAHQAGTQQSLAESITRSVYSNDYAGTVAPFDSQTKATVTRAQLGDLSDRMHALGSYQGLTQTGADADRGRYEFDAKFSGGHMTVLMRLDPSGKVGAYRVIPGAPRAAATPAA